MKTCFYTLTVIAALCTCTNKKAEITCSDYGIAEIEKLIQPHLSDTLYTAFVMQEQNSGYNMSTIAAQALEMDTTYPDSVTSLLKKIAGSICEEAS